MCVVYVCVLRKGVLIKKGGGRQGLGQPSLIIVVMKHCEEGIRKIQCTECFCTNDRVKRHSAVFCSMFLYQ